MNRAAEIAQQKALPSISPCAMIPLGMADPTYIPGIAPTVLGSPRHSLLVRTTHWIHTAAFLGLLVSGIAILLAHPRLYWGEAGGVGAPSLIDLPLPFVLTGQTGWGRSLHFLSAWVCVLAGLPYVLSGIFGCHFRDDFFSSQTLYNPIQRVAYVAVVFGLFPLIVATGLAMSPAISSVFPELVVLLQGQQSARTIHFFVAALLVVFLIAHVTMVVRAGFIHRMRGMITGERL